MHCSACGATVEEGADYCSECGAAVGDDATDRAPTGGGSRTSQSGAGTASRADSGWATTRKVAAGGGLLAGVSLFLPWVTAVRGDFSANGMATDFAPVVAGGAIAVVVFAGANWGRGWGWLSMLATGLAGVGVAAAAFLFREIVSETVTLSRVSIDGQLVPVAALQPATGVQLALAGGALAALAAVAGIAGALTGS